MTDISPAVSPLSLENNTHTLKAQLTSLLSTPSTNTNTTNTINTNTNTNSKNKSSSSSSTSSSSSSSTSANAPTQQHKFLFMKLSLFLSEFTFELRKRPTLPALNIEPMVIPRELTEIVAEVVALFVSQYFDNTNTNTNTTKYHHQRQLSEDDNIEDLQQQQQQPLPSPSHNTSDLAMFIRSVLRRSMVSFSSVLVALLYIHRTNSSHKLNSTISNFSNFKYHSKPLFMAALITAEKYLYDIGTVGLDYDLRYWSQACKSFTVSELNDMEIVFLSELDYSCSVSEQEFKLVLSNLKKFVDSPEAVSSFVLSPPSTPSPCRSPSSTD